MPQYRKTHRWWFASFVALSAAAIGVITARPLPVLIGAIGVVYAVFGRISPPPSISLEINRAVSDPEPSPGDEVTVTVTVRNTGAPLTDVRLIDGVPAALEVVNGSPRHGSALAIQGETSFSYSVVAERGQHGFEPITVLARDPSGAIEREISIESETIITCQPPLSDVPLRSNTTQFTGRITTDESGSGVEFHTTREYRPGDDLSRIDWNRRARSGELTTIEFREERAARVMLVIDARPEAYWTPNSETRHAVEHAVAAAGRVFVHLLAGGDRVGITAFGREECWLAPNTGTDHEFQARRLLATHPALSYEPPKDDLPELTIDPEHGSIDIQPLVSRLSADTQMILFTPLCDDGIVEAAQRLEARDRATSIISPDVTTDETLGNRLARIQRANRIHQLRETDIRVIDWDVSAPLIGELTRAEVTQ